MDHGKDSAVTRLLEYSYYKRRDHADEVIKNMIHYC